MFSYDDDSLEGKFHRDKDSQDEPSSQKTTDSKSLADYSTSHIHSFTERRWRIRQCRWRWRWNIRSETCLKLISRSTRILLLGCASLEDCQHLSATTRDHGYEGYSWSCSHISDQSMLESYLARHRLFFIAIQIRSSQSRSRAETLLREWHLRRWMGFRSRSFTLLAIVRHCKIFFVMPIAFHESSSLFIRKTSLRDGDSFNRHWLNLSV